MMRCFFGIIAELEERMKYESGALMLINSKIFGKNDN
jgi:hypothetical protein